MNVVKTNYAPKNTIAILKWIAQNYGVQSKKRLQIIDRNSNFTGFNYSNSYFCSISLHFVLFFKWEKFRIFYFFIEKSRFNTCNRSITCHHLQHIHITRLLDQVSYTRVTSLNRILNYVNCARACYSFCGDSFKRKDMQNVLQTKCEFKIQNNLLSIYLDKHKRDVENCRRCIAINMWLWCVSGWHT